MSHVPKFVTQKAQYDSELLLIKDFESMKAFEKKWFDTDQWPKKSQAQQAKEQSNKRWPFEMDGRFWGHTSFLYDVTPEARYVYLKYVHEVSFPLEYPDFHRDSYDMYDCPFCEISTNDPGGAACPKCQRNLVGIYRSR